MVFNESDDFNQNGSIFNDNPINAEASNNLTAGSGILELFNSFVEKFIEEPKKKLELRALQKKADKLFGENEEIFKIFYSFGCNLYVDNGFIEIEYPQLKLVGKITFTEDGKAEFDENTNKIMTQLAKLINNTNNLGNMMDKYEQEEFYPIGELEQTTVNYKGEEINALSGMLINKKGETKKIYYYKGKEIFLDE